MNILYFYCKIFRKSFIAVRHLKNFSSIFALSVREREMQTETETKTEAEHTLAFIHFHRVTLEKSLHGSHF